MYHVYTGRIRVSHHELDAFGRVYPAAYLRHLVTVAVDASTAAGFDGGWYARNGVHWLVRRTTFELGAPAVAGMELEIRSWVEDFRRVRSQRRYEVRSSDGAPLLDAVTDWVLVETMTGKLRRIPEEMERCFGTAPGGSRTTRAAWTAPPAPPTAARATYPVRYTDLDALAHVNNAAYVDVLMHAGLDALGRAGWTLDRLLAEGAAPHCARGDVEYLDAARFGDELAVTTWFTPGDDALGLHQELVRADDGRALVRFTGAWQWLDPASRESAPTPPGLVRALEEVVAA